MSKRALKFNDIVVNKKDFHVSKKAILLNSVNTNNSESFLSELNTVMTVINILLVIYMMMVSLDRCVLIYHK